jgi:16S rRNA (guanine966-N2)-methyltransferase
MTRRRQDTSADGRRRPPGGYRIIAGRWRGRRVSFPDEGGVRPTGDRVRETVFNWLQPVAPGSRCLDLFAGSGALGLEALSRGAREVVFVDRSRAATPFDIVFLDPPFGSVGWADLCAALQEGGWLAPRARVYIEDAAGAGAPVLPAGWELLRSARAGNVGYHLAAAPGGSDDRAPGQGR